MPTRHRMALGLYDARGHRKYLTTAERTAFLIAAEEALREVRTLCGLLAHTGCRLSEALWLTADRVDFRADLVVFETLKKRYSGVYRAVPVPHTLVDMLDLVHGLRPLQGRSDHGRNHRLWSWSRMTGWRRVCEVMARAGVRGPQASPKGLRHGFGVAAVTAGVPLNLVQKWLGHAQLSTTAIYADAVGEEEHAMAARMWRGQAEHHPAPRAPHGYELPMHGQALHGQLPCPVKARTRARVLTNTGLHTARGGARVVRAKTLALRWSVSGRLCRASPPPRSDLCSTLRCTASRNVEQCVTRTRWLHYREDDFILRDFVFTSGEVLPALRLHYRTIGVPRRDASGMIVNGVLLLQGNTGTGANWLRPSLADELYGPGQPLDAHRYVLIMPDAIGRGGSSKPSDGLRGHFPHYRYRDMVASGYRCITEGLGVGHLRLVIGSSMGGMHAWMWAELYPDLMDGVVALSCQPVEISGRNWLARRAAAEAIRHDPDWNNGFYEQNPRHYIYSAAGNFTTESPTRIQEMAPTLAAANALYERRLAEAAQGDANNELWAIEAIQDCNPEPDLDKITAKVLLINDAEDHANPPELGTVERAMQRVTHGRYVLLPAGPDTHGHFSHYYARLWKPYLIEFMATLGPEQTGAAAVHEARGRSSRHPFL